MGVQRRAELLSLRLVAFQRHLRVSTIWTVHLAKFAVDAR